MLRIQDFRGEVPMAEIPLTKKSGSKWWIWLILLLVVAALVWWWLSGNEGPEEVGPAAETETAVENPYADVDELERGAPLPVLTEISNIRQMDDPDELQGRRADLDGVNVESVVGDRTFTINDGEGNSLFVVLDQVPTPGTPTEGRYDINPGQVIDVEGEIRGVIDGMVDGEAIEDMPQGTEIYLFAQRADIEERP
jgi:hypothetical protein